MLPVFECSIRTVEYSVRGLDLGHLCGGMWCGWVLMVMLTLYVQITESMTGNNEN